MTILTKTFNDATIFSDKMKCFSLQTNNHVLHNGDQRWVNRGNRLSEFCKSAHISFCFILFTKATKLFSHSRGRQRLKNEVPWCFHWDVDKGVFPFSFYDLCAWLGSNPHVRMPFTQGVGPPYGLPYLQILLPSVIRVCPVTSLGRCIWTYSWVWRRHNLFPNRLIWS